MADVCDRDDSYRLLRNETRVKIFGLGFRKRPNFRSRGGSGKQYWLVVVVVALSTALVTVLLLVWSAHRSAAEPPGLVPPDPDRPQLPSPSILQRFNHSAVCSDGAPCSRIGRDILKAGGNAVDAAIAALFCNGVVNSQSMGLGGGFLMTLRVDGKTYTVNAREMAPSAANKDMFHKNATLSRTGGLAVGVPGELVGYYEVWKKLGSLEWRKLIEPTIELCRDGYPMSQAQYNSLLFRPTAPRNDPILKEMFIDKHSNEYKKAGTFIKPIKICDTLKIIAIEGGHALNNGSLTSAFVKDIQDLGGIITEDDMRNYRVEWEPPVTVKLNGGYTLETMGPPGSGALLAYILTLVGNVERPYANLDDAASPTSINATVSVMQRVIEAFKMAFAKRPLLGDPQFVNVSKVMNELTSVDSAKKSRTKIRLSRTSQDPSYYGSVEYSTDDHGTAHLSILSAAGDAVSVTSTINLYFGAGFTSKSTGIVLNSVMDDFSSPGVENYFGLKPSPNHFVQGGKRPLSSACPSIVLDANGDVALVIGASGGTKIPTAVAWVMIRYLWFGETIKEAVDASRFHHQLYPMRVEYEYGVLEQIIKALQQLGHETYRYRGGGSIVCAIAKKNGTIYANADYRKGGEVYGL